MYFCWCKSVLVRPTCAVFRTVAATLDARCLQTSLTVITTLLTTRCETDENDNPTNPINSTNNSTSHTTTTKTNNTTMQVIPVTLCNTTKFKPKKGGRKMRRKNIEVNFNANSSRTETAVSVT